MIKVVEDLQALKLHGMAQACESILSASADPALIKLLQQLIEAEQLERDVRRIRYQMAAAKFPHHKDFCDL